MTAPSQAEIDAILQRLNPAEMAAMLDLMEELDARKRLQLARSDFLAFIALIDPAYKFGAHLKRLGGLLMDVEKGAEDRIAVSMAPRMGKSQMISIYYPAWYLGRHPDHKVIVASHTADLAVTMGRKVRNLMQTHVYSTIFPDVKIAADAKAAGQWNTNKGGEFYTSGVGGALAGRGGHLIVVDDPLSEQDIKSGNTKSLDVAYEWFVSGLRTRLMPGGKIAILHCLTGDTAVTQADGSTKTLRDVRPGDSVLSYDNGVLRPANVLGWANQGLDRVYAIALKSGVIIRGNERHPLLVDLEGIREWKTIKELRPGMSLVATYPTAQARPTRAESANTTTTKLAARTRLVLNRLTGAANATKSVAQRVAAGLRTAGGFALGALTKKPTQPAKRKVLIIVLPSAATPTSKCSMGSLALNTTGCLPTREVYATSAASPRTQTIPHVLGKSAGSLWTTAMRRAKSALSCATLATSSSKTATLPTCSEKPSSTLSITLDEILSITPDGVEEVFDIEVEGTESFLANGVVSHNTRWHQRDLIGRLIKDSALNEDGDQYNVFEFPAILHEGTENEKSLWPEQWSLESLLRTKASMPLWQWNAQYMQNPTAQESAIIKREWIRWWPKEDPPPCDFIVQAFDTALTTKERSDYSVCHTWGVFTDETDGDSTNVILLNSVKGKYEFPELKVMALDQYKDWEPDAVIVEAKASGQPLIDEMRRSGLFVQDFSPGKGQDKIARLNAVADMFANGQVWFPETGWAQATVDELLAFPAGENDDEVDALTLALRRIRQGGLLRLRTDYEDNSLSALPRKTAYY